MLFFKFLRVLSLLLFFSSLLANEKVSLQLKWKDSFQFAGFYMAKEKGFYSDVGLDVTLIELDNSSSLVDSVMSGRTTYGIGDTALVYHRLKQTPVTLMMPILETTPIALLTTRDVDSLEDFKSSKIFINRFSFESPAILSMLHLSNVDIDKFKKEDGVFSVEDILQQKLDLYSVYLPNQPYYLKKHNIPYHLFAPKDYGLDFYGDILFTSQNELEKHFDRAIAFMDASKKGWEYALLHIDETIELIEKKYNSQHFSKDELRFQASAYKKLVCKTYKFDKQKIENIKIIFKLLYKIKENFEYEDFILNRYVTTKEERDFLKNHTVKCITTTNWAPFNILKSGEVKGLGIDYWNIIAQKLNIDNSCQKVDSFSSLLEQIKTKRADITISTSETAQRKKYAIFSKSYVSFPIVFATKKGVSYISDVKRLQDKTVAVVKNHTATKMLQKRYPDFHYIQTDTLEEALNLVKRSDAYAAAEILPVLAYKMNNEKYNELKISGKTDFEFPVKFMIRDDYKVLLPMINRVISSIDEDTKKEIYERWISVNMQNGYSTKKVNRLILIVGAILFLFAVWVVLLILQINERKKVEAQLEKLANYDKLTSIYNRHKLDSFLSEHLKRIKRYNRPLSVIFFDIDKFKNINDTYGHKTGDKILQEIASHVSKNIRESDIFGRWGGEEFLIIAPETDLKMATKLAEKLRIEIQEYSFFEVEKLTCSFGVIEVQSTSNIDDIMKQVDTMLYRAKESGRNRVVSALKIDKDGE